MKLKLGFEIKIIINCTPCLAIWPPGQARMLMHGYACIGRGFRGYVRRAYALSFP